MRLRIQRERWPRPALILTDTPRPRCPDCHGIGGWAHTCVSPEGEYDGTDWFECFCWDSGKRWKILPVPHFRRTGYSDEPPF
ncbi:hypothetical protein [Streptomyces sp. NBRC 109706]|uniref:hypothetical protein n=1 Tax=Streptomyces sp. NBRC 109706 TaxID=1550035 RepID=UPI0007823771|nr:hypothetical protein [Streptomyces sp. NBRC 109706]